MRHRPVVVMALVVGACAQIVGIEEDLPVPQAVEDSGVDVAVEAGSETASDAVFDVIKGGPDGGSGHELSPCTACTCKHEPAAGAEGEIFKDVPPTVLEAPAVAAMYLEGVIGHCEEVPHLFCPGCQLTRGVLAKWIVLASGEPLVDEEVPTFPDVPKNHPQYAYIETAYAKTWMVGFSDGTFHPDANISRATTAVIVAKAAGLSPPLPLPTSFTDVPAGASYRASVEALFAACVTTGCNSVGPQFCPDKIITRRGGVVMVARAFKVIEGPCSPEPGD